MKDKQYALIVVCKQFLDTDDYELQMEDSEEWVVEDMYGYDTTHSVLHSVPTTSPSFLLLKTLKSSSKSGFLIPWWIVPKEWKVVEVGASLRD